MIVSRAAGFGQRLGGAVCVLFGAMVLAGSAAQAGSFDHTKLDAILKQYVNDRGLVNYAELLKNRQALDVYLNRIGCVTQTELQAWDRNEQIALYINAYNAITLARIINDYPPKSWGLIGPKVSIKNISGVWDKKTNRVAEETLTLDDLEDRILREKYKEPRIHAAIFGASVGGPFLRTEAYTGARLEEQLEDQARRFAREPSRNSVDVKRKVVTLSPIFDWFKPDFAVYSSGATKLEEASGKAKSLAGGVGFLVKYGDPEVKEFLQKGKYAVKVGDYDWSLNSQ